MGTLVYEEVTCVKSRFSLPPFHNHAVPPLKGTNIIVIKSKIHKLEAPAAFSISNIQGAPKNLGQVKNTITVEHQVIFDSVYDVTKYI